MYTGILVYQIPWDPLLSFDLMRRGWGGVSLAQIWTHTHTTDQKGASGSPIQIPLKSLKAEV